MNRKKRSIIWKINKEDLQILYNQNSSTSAILKTLGIKAKSGNFKTIQKRIIEDNICLKKFNTNKEKANKEQRSKNFWKAFPLEQILVENSTYCRQTLKKRLIKEGLLENKCEICGMPPEWQNKELALQLDHKNGISTDNRLINLRLLCPNCHSQTDNYAGKKNKKIKIKNKKIGNKSPRPEYRKVERPNKEELHKMLWEMPTVKIANKYGVSDKAVEKWTKSYGIDKPPRGYWGFINRNENNK